LTGHRRVHIPETELHLIPVVPRFGRGQDGKSRKPFEAFKGDEDLVLLDGELDLIGSVLERAAAAGPEVAAANG
jgi:hypothetical protein